MVKEEKLKSVKIILEAFTDTDFNSYIPKTMLKLSQKEIDTIQFVFWFCHIVERDLDSALQQAFRNMESIMGKTPKKLVDLIKERFGVRIEKVDPNNPKYDPECITFNDRIDIVEKSMGKSDHTRFLRKIKKLRNDLSHGRIDDLTYEGKDLAEIETKRILIFDYIKQALEIKDIKSEGGVANELTEQDKRRIDELYQKFEKRNTRN